MSREIKFRAWSKKHNRYLKITGIQYDGDKIAGVFVVYGIIAGIPNIIFLEPEDIVLEQDTGLKDKNGKEICEGDIVKVVGVGVSRVIQSGWGEWQLCDLTNSDGNILSLGYCLGREYCEAIGNIHENPELLGGEE